MGIRSYFSQINTKVSSRIREMSDTSQPQRTPRARREIVEAISETLERRLLFAAGPTAGSFTATPATITTASSTSEGISITYTDMTTPVLATSIARGNITVTGPGSVGVLAGGTATAVPNMDAASVVGNYTVTAPVGGWTSADDGTYTVALNATVTDTSGNAVTANPSIGTFTVNIAAPGPTATLTTPTNITSAGGTTKSIVVTYTDSSSPINVSTIAPGNITVTGPGSTALTVLSATPSPATNGSPITVTYVVQAPGGTAWSVADDGTYTIGLTNGVKDVATTAVTANPAFGSFTVAIVNPPTATFTPPATIVPHQTTFTFTVVYTDTMNLISAASIGIKNVTVTGPTGLALQVVSAVATPNTNNNTISVVYTVDSPSALGFGPTDSGIYTVALTGIVPGAVTDTLGNPVAAGPLGTFTVSIVDANAPIPTLLQNFDITETGQLSKQIVIEYTDSFGVDPTTITIDNISVVSSTGTGTPIIVTSAVANSTLPIPILQATYTIAKADGTAFTAADNGTYIISINPPPLSPANISGVHVGAVPMFGSFVVDVPDQISPTGVITAPDITTTGVATQTITAVLTDNVAIRVYTIHADNLIVIAPDGEQIPVAQVIGLNQPNASTITVQFIIDAPNGTFTSADNGVYSISLSSVTDTSGNFMVTAFGSFDIDIPGAFVPNFSLGTFAATKGKNKLKFRDAPDGTVGILTIKNGTGEAIQEGTTNAIDLVLNDVGKGVDITLKSSNGRPITLNNVFVHGTLVNFNAPIANVTGTFYVNGTAEKATFAHLVGTTLTPAVFAASGPIQDLIVNKATTQAVIISGAMLGTTGLLNEPGDTFSSGEIDSVTLGGQLTSTVVAAGVAPGPDGVFGTGDDTSAGTGSIIHTVIANSGTGPAVKFEANGFGIFKFSRKKFTPDPTTDTRFVLLP